LFFVLVLGCWTRERKLLKNKKERGFGQPYSGHKKIDLSITRFVIEIGVKHR
jgi:hypothetical protein